MHTAVYTDIHKLLNNMYLEVYLDWLPSLRKHDYPWDQLSWDFEFAAFCDCYPPFEKLLENVGTFFDSKHTKQ